MALKTDIVAYWKMQGNSDDDVGSNDGADTSISYGTSYGKIDQGALFSNSSGSLMKISNSGQFDFDGEAFSISFWIKPTNWDTGKSYTLIDFEDAGWGGWLLRHERTLTYLSGNNDQQLSDGKPTTGVWTHVVFTSNGTNGKMYYNGSLNYTQNSLTYNGNSTSDYGLGCNTGDNNQSYYGSMDEVGIWDRELTSAEITTLYNSGSGLQYPFVTAKPRSFAQII